MAEFALEINNLQKVYDNNIVALKGIDLKVQKGDFYALLGPNGAGKSSTIGIIGSLVTKSAGKVSVFGNDIDTDLNKAKSMLGVVSQEINFSQFEKVLDIVVTQAGFYVIPKSIAMPKVENILKRFGLSVITNNYQSFSSGEDRKTIDIKRDDFSLKILPLICYEIIYSGKIFNNSNFDLMLNISEDGWFGSSIGPKQHFAHSIFRAVESGKYLLRSANNGIAAIVNPLGIIEQKVEYGQSGYIDFKKAKKIQPTLFSKHGNKIFIILILIYIFLIFSFNRFRNE